ncbi:hypothetical protein Pint_04804 [Pistacia integerrima]|uniref:Uncharacterized protein n=1 Tax=Pistacia integerrima TaxID=434235 RepID=A0ACC0Z897_9ROSI|nr:hypothetical protein Pint_04804 [Pistacia integerrima]
MAFFSRLSFLMPRSRTTSILQLPTFNPNLIGIIRFCKPAPPPVRKGDPPQTNHGGHEETRSADPKSSKNYDTEKELKQESQQAASANKSKDSY